MNILWGPKIPIPLNPEPYSHMQKLQMFSNDPLKDHGLPVLGCGAFGLQCPSEGRGRDFLFPGDSGVLSLFGDFGVPFRTFHAGIILGSPKERIPNYLNAVWAFSQPGKNLKDV